MNKRSVYGLIIAMAGLLVFGLVFLASVSAYAKGNNGDAYYFIRYQCRWLGIGLIACYFVARLDYHRWMKYSPWLFGAGLVLMVMCFLPGIGVYRNGAHRWVYLGWTVQPMEFAKFGLVMSLAWWFGVKEKAAGNFKEGMLVPLTALGIFAALCALQKDIGTAALALGLTLIVMFVAGVKWRYLGGLVLLGLAGIAALTVASPQKMSRVLAFINPEQHIASGVGDQLRNALIALGSGGLTGRGLGQGVQKMKYLSESQTDFIFPNLGEELGLIATLTVVFLFLLLVVSGGEIATYAKDKTGLLAGLGAIALIGFQSLMNLFVTTGMAPTKGIGLPFISYGGTNLVLCFTLIGVLLNIHFQADYGSKKSRPANLPEAMTARM